MKALTICQPLRAAFMRPDFDYEAFRQWHESVIAPYAASVQQELRDARVKFFRVAEQQLPAAVLP